MRRKETFQLGLAIVLMLAGCSAAGTGNTDSAAFRAADEILTYEPVEGGRTIITVENATLYDFSVLKNAVEKKFPDVELVALPAAPGTNMIAYMALQAQNGTLADIQFSVAVAPENDFLYDFSAESFTGRYNMSSLNSVSVDGKLYQIPVTNTLFGIAYNKTLFDKNGWQVPATLDEFYALCDTIQAAGIRPFVPCFKYYTVIESTGLLLAHDQVFRDAGCQARFDDFLNKKGSSKELLEPMFNVLKNLYDKGYITADDFSSSATDNRQALYKEQIAMIPNNTDIITFIKDEKPADEIGFMGFPTAAAGKSWMQMSPGNRISVAKAAMKDAVKKQAILKILDYLSTDEGQQTIFQCFTGISSLSSYQSNVSAGSEEVNNCIAGGRIMYTTYYGSNDDIVPAFQKWITGQCSLEDIIAANDGFQMPDLMSALSKEPIGTASEGFTVLETSLLNADVIRTDTDADIGLILNDYYFTGNLAEIEKGSILLPERFILKGVSAKSYLTKYRITGASLKKLIEHPIINGNEVNAMYAVSGLKMTYAPWADAGANVISLSLADGTALDDAAVYTVSAWAGSIDSSYLSGTVQEYPDLGANKDIMTAAIQKAGTIAPVKDGRITLQWQ